MSDLNQSAGGHASGGIVQDTDAMHTLPDDEEIAIPENEDIEMIYNPKWIGNVRCYWHNDKGVPRLTIGPNWGFTCLLVAMVSAVFYLSASAQYKMIKMDAEWYYLLIGFCLIGFGLWAFLSTLLGDPGIPPEVYDARAHPNR